MPFGMSQHLCCERLFHHACANSQGSFSIRIPHSLDILSHSPLLRSPDHLQPWLEAFCVKKETFLFSLVISFWFLEAVLEVYLEPLWLQCLVPFVTGWFHILPCSMWLKKQKAVYFRAFSGDHGAQWPDQFWILKSWLTQYHPEELDMMDEGWFHNCSHLSALQAEFHHMIWCSSTMHTWCSDISPPFIAQWFIFPQPVRMCILSMYSCRICGSYFAFSKFSNEVECICWALMKSVFLLHLVNPVTLMDQTTSLFLVMWFLQWHLFRSLLRTQDQPLWQQYSPDHLVLYRIQRCMW